MTGLGRGLALTERVPYGFLHDLARTRPREKRGLEGAASLTWRSAVV
jgi:hypothetical protein